VIFAYGRLQQRREKADSMPVPKMADKPEIPAQARQKLTGKNSRPRVEQFRAQKSGTFVPEKVIYFSNHLKPFQTKSRKSRSVASIFSSTPTFSLV